MKWDAHTNYKKNIAWYTGLCSHGGSVGMRCDRQRNGKHLTTTGGASGLQGYVRAEGIDRSDARVVVVFLFGDELSLRGWGGSNPDAAVEELLRWENVTVAQGLESQHIQLIDNQSRWAVKRL